MIETYAVSQVFIGSVVRIRDSLVDCRRAAYSHVSGMTLMHLIGSVIRRIQEEEKKAEVCDPAS